MAERKSASGFAYTGVQQATCADMRKLIGEWIASGPSGETRKMWDILTCLRGPDSPSERPCDSAEINSLHYSQRRDRKYRTVEVIRAAAFHGIVGGSARYHQAKEVILPPSSRWDHFDKHVARAAGALGLGVKTEDYGYEG